MRKNVLLIINLLFFNLSCVSSKEASISKVYMYDYNDGGRGYTTASAYGQLNCFEQDSVQPILLDSADCALVREIIQRTDEKKLHPNKIGQNILFFLFYFDYDKSYHKIVLCQNNCFIDYDKKRIYVLTNEKDMILLNEMREKYHLPIIK